MESKLGLNMELVEQAMISMPLDTGVRKWLRPREGSQA